MMEEKVRITGDSRTNLNDIVGTIKRLPILADNTYIVEDDFNKVKYKVLEENLKKWAQ